MIVGLVISSVGTPHVIYILDSTAACICRNSTHIRVDDQPHEHDIVDLENGAASSLSESIPPNISKNSRLSAQRSPQLIRTYSSALQDFYC